MGFAFRVYPWSLLLACVWSALPWPLSTGRLPKKEVPKKEEAKKPEEPEQHVLSSLI
jgi:hypothetical protein